MRNIAMAAVLDLLFGARRAEVPTREVICNWASDDDSAELRFFVELAERANDRLLNDIRGFNAVAYMLLGPLLAIATFIDYHDVHNLVPLVFTASAGIAALAALWLGDGTPMPNPDDDELFAQFDNDTESTWRNVIADLRRWAPRNSAARERKRRFLVWASRFALMAIIGTAAIKAMELR